MFCDEGSTSRVQEFGTLDSMIPSHSLAPIIKTKKKRNLPGNPDPEAEVIALSPRTLLATNRFVCEICNRGFQRDQNLQLHRRGHNLPWKLKQRSGKDNRKRAYVCPEPSCLHHHPSRALGDLTGIKKHYCRKHGEKKWKCDKCEKIYAVQSDWKAHSKTCGTREYRCDCGTLFSRKDSFITHRAFCDALAEESARLSAATNSLLPPNPNPGVPENLPALLPFSAHFRNPWTPHVSQNPNPNQESIKHETLHNIPISSSSPLYRGGALMTPPFGNLHVNTALPPLSATALLQKAATMGAAEGPMGSTMVGHMDMHMWQKNSDGQTRDFLGLTGGEGTSNVGGMTMPFTGGVKFPAAYNRDRSSVFKHHGFGFTETCSGWSNC